VIIYVHVPKCAGITLATALRSCYGKENILNLHTLDKPLREEIETVPQHVLDQARLILGHVHYGIHEFLSGRCLYVTLLREPVDRVLSLYKYILRDRAHPLHEHMHRTGMTLEEYVSSGVDEDQTHNGMTRQLSGDDRGTRPDDRSLASAKDNLSTFAAVGLTERFDESFVLLRRRLGLRMPFYISRNASPRTQSSVAIPRSALELIRAENQLDIALYAYGANVFQRHINQEGGTLARDVLRLKRWNPLMAAVGARVTDSRLREPVGRVARGVLAWRQPRSRKAPH
jgi:hypothetical protein